MKLHLPVLLLGLSLATPLVRGAYSHKEAFSKTAAFNPTGSVVVDNVNGSVEIQAWDKNEISIAGEKSAKTDEELQRIELTIDLAPDRATVKVRLPKRGGFFGGTIRASVRLKLMVPAHAVIKEANSVNGSITLAGLQGPVEAHTVNGRIVARDLAADAELHTVNGSIQAGFATVAAGQHLEFKTVNGSVAITLPADAGVAFHAGTVNGHIDCDFPLRLEGGRVSQRKLDGTIGDGRATLRAGTVNGSIALRKP